MNFSSTAQQRAKHAVCARCVHWGHQCRTLCDVTELQSVATEPGPGGLRGLFARFEHLVRELGKFGTVGIVSFVVDVTIFNVLLFGGTPTLVAKTISTVVAATVVFIGNRFWTWRDRERTNLPREYGLYFLFNLVGLIIGLDFLSASLLRAGLGVACSTARSPTTSRSTWSAWHSAPCSASGRTEHCFPQGRRTG